MLAVARDEPDAFERLVAAYQNRVKGLVARSIVDRSSVEDLAQEVFLRLYRARHRYQPTARFETYLYRIVFNLCVNHTQFSARRKTWSLDAPLGSDQEGGSLEPVDERAGVPLDALEEDERAALVRSAVEKLPEAQREALILSRFEGLGYEQIGEILGLSLPAVKSLLWRARDGVRQRLRPILGDPSDAD